MRNLLLLLCISTACSAADNVITFTQPFKRDPFSTSDKMHAYVGQQVNNPYGGFIPSYGAQKLPQMRLKGFVTKKRKKATALLDVKGAGVYMVSKGDQIGLHAIGMNTVLEIVDVTSNGVKVRSGQINQVIVVR